MHVNPPTLGDDVSQVEEGNLLHQAGMLPNCYLKPITDGASKRRLGWFTTKYPVALAVGGLDWAQVVAGGAALGAVVKDAKKQLRALPDGLTYGVLRF
jgi:hypothetical protein